MDLFAAQVDFNVFDKRKEDALGARRTELNTIWNSAQVRHNALLIGTDASVPENTAVSSLRTRSSLLFGLPSVVPFFGLGATALSCSLTRSPWRVGRWTHLSTPGRCTLLLSARPSRRGSLVIPSAPSCLWRPLPS